MTPSPVTVMTGLLASGKTTLLSHVRREPRFSDTAVVINEFGEVGLDHARVAASRVELVGMTSGRPCCTIRGDIGKTLVELHARSSSGTIPTFSRLIIETTGLADAAPVLHTLIADPLVRPRYSLGAGVTTVDTVNGAAIVDRGSSDFDLRRHVDTAPYDRRSNTLDVQTWLNEEAYRSGVEEPDEDRRTRIVFITRNLPRSAIEPVIAAFDGSAAASGGSASAVPEALP